MKTRLYIYIIILLYIALPSKAFGQTQKGGFMSYIVDENNDTIFVDELPASRVFQKMPKQKGKDWRKYYRLVHNFSKTYPYAIVAKKLIIEADSTILANDFTRGQRERYINSVQDELFTAFEKPLRGMTVTQGALLMKLIDREVGLSSYAIIRNYKSRIAAGFWQGVAKLFGSDMKKNYDPEGEDKLTEELVMLWESGDFPEFYYSLFWKYPPEIEIPSKYK